MSKSNLLIYLFFFFTKALFCQELKYEWSNVLKSSTSEYNDISFDLKGNYYSVGTFRDTLFQDSINTISLGLTDIVITKNNKIEKKIWQKTFGGIDNDYPYSIKTDNQDNIYVIGRFNGQVDFDPSENYFYLNSQMYGDFFLLKLNGNGEFQWVNIVNGYLLEIDNNNIYVSGNFSGIVDFDPSSKEVFVNGNQGSHFISIFSFNGLFLKVHNLGNVGRIEFLKTNQDKIILGVSYSGTKSIYFKDLTENFHSYNSTSVIFILTKEFELLKKYDFSNSDDNSENQIRFVKTDNLGNVLVTGTLKGKLNFNSHVYQGDFFVTKLNLIDTTFWMKTFKCKTYNPYLPIDIDEKNNIYIVGSVKNDFQNDDFDPSDKIYNPKLWGIFILKLNDLGEFIDIKTLQSTESENYIYKIKYLNNSLILVGYIGGEVNTDWLNKNEKIKPYSINQNGIIIKYRNCLPSTNNLKISKCDQFDLGGGNVFYKSGKYTIVIPNHLGCDSIISLDLTINNAYDIYTGISGIDTTICEGSSIKLKGKGPAVSYSWDKGVIDNVTFTPLISDTYTVTGTEINGCTSMASVIINVAKYPDIKIINQWGRILCQSESVKLSSQSSMGGLTYCWKLNGEILKYQTNSTLTNGLGGDYSLEVSKNGCKTLSEIERVQKIITPTIDTPSILQICQGSLAPNLHSNDTVGEISWNYSSNNKDWYLFENIDVQTIKGLDIGVLNSTKYIRCIVNTPWCPDVVSNPIKLNVNQRPAVSGGVDQTVCVGTETVVWGQGALNYNWDFGIENSKPFIIDTTKTLTVIGTDINGCKDTASVTIYTYPASKIQISEPETVICTNEVFTLNTTSENVYTYQWKNNNLLIPNETSNTLKSKLSGDFIVVVTNIQGCETVSAPLTISPLPVPEIDAGENQTICKGDSVILNASKADKFTWENNFQNGVFVSPQNTTSYKVLTTGLNGCTNQDSVIIYVNQPSFHIENVTSTGSFYLNNIPYSSSGQYTQHLKNHLGCDSIITLNLVIDKLGVEEKSDTFISIHPNPTADGKVFVNANNINSISVYDVNGVQLKVVENTSFIDFSMFSKGVYWLEVKSHSSLKRFKIIFI